MPILCYSEHSPPPTLNRVVDAVWSVAVDPGGDATPQHWVLPDGCVSVSAHFHEHMIAVHMRPASAVAFRRPCTPGEKMVGLRIRPGHRRSIDLEELVRRLAGQSSPRSFADAEWLLCHAAARSLRDEPDARIRLMVDRLRDSKGSAVIRELAEASGVSDRHLERLSLEALGFPPKVLARIVRLQAAVRDIVARPARNLKQNLADTAAATGYADQAHLRRDFVALAQLPPSGYLRLIRDVRFTLGKPMSDSF